MGFLTPYLLVDIFLLLGSAITSYYIYFKLYLSKVWSERGIPYVDPTFIIGNRSYRSPEPLFRDLNRFYEQNIEKQLLGVWLFVKPALLIIDIDLVKNILIKDFSHFHDRGIYANEEKEPLTGHLFLLGGQKWRNLRVKLTPTFTSGKMKMMFDTMLESGTQLQEYLQGPAGAGDVLDMKDLMSSFTTQVIGSCAFGIDLKSIGNPDCPFQKYGKMVFQPSFRHFVERMILVTAVRLGEFLNLKTMPKAATDFFMQTAKDVMEEREKHNIKRNDFMDLLLQLKNKGAIEDADTKYSKDEKAGTDKFTAEQAAAQAFVFLIAGYETSSTSLMFTAYELAKNPEIQERLQREIDQTLKEEKGIVSYSMIQRMEYLDQVIQESLRMYAPFPVTFRECTKRYQVPNSEYVLEKGDFLLIPIQSIHSDPKYFPNPEKFDPDRYSKENSEYRDPFLNLVFGNGPRNCIGARFGLQQIKVGLVSILSKYRLEMAETTPAQIKYETKTLVPIPAGGIPLRVTKR